MDVRRRMQIGGIKKTSSGGDDVIPEPIIDINNYLTIEALENGLTASLSTNACEYCIDGDGKWKTLTAGTATESINSGHTLSFRGNLTPVANSGIGTFKVNKKFNLNGNVMSMLFGDAGKDNYSLSGKDYAFDDLFYGCTTLQSVSANFLSATTLANSCYNGMFMSCKSLTVAPELPATTLANSCYSYMFRNCTRLTTAPELPATTLANSCYASMFMDCTSLTTAPALPATTLANSCYKGMFYFCRELNYIKMLATNISAKECLYNWVYDVSSSGTFVKHPNMTSLPTGTSGVPSGWTVVNDGEENGGKIVNHGVITINSLTSTSITFEYPVATELEVTCGDATFSLLVGSTKTSWSLGPGESLGSTVSFYPSNEDDTYIYEVTIEQ